MCTVHCSQPGLAPSVSEVNCDVGRRNWNPLLSGTVITCAEDTGVFTNCGALTDFYDEVDTENIDFNCSGNTCNLEPKDPSRHEVYPKKIWCQGNRPNYQGSKLIAYPKGSTASCGNFYEAWPSALEAGIKAECANYKCELHPADGDDIVWPFKFPKCNRGNWAFGRVAIPEDTVFTSISWSEYREEDNPYLDCGRSARTTSDFRSFVGDKTQFRSFSQEIAFCYPDNWFNINYCNFYCPTSNPNKPRKINTTFKCAKGNWKPKLTKKRQNSLKC